MKVKNLFLFDGKKVSEQQIGFEHIKRGFFYGDGIFETMRAVRYKIFMFDRHISRMTKGIAFCNMDIPNNWKNLQTDIKRLLEEERLEDAYIRVNAWRMGNDSFDPKEERKSHLLVLIKKYQPYNENFYRKGVSCVVSKKFFKNEKSPFASIKSFNYLESILARQEARTKGCDEAILLNTKGELAESTVSNLFFINKKTVYTPSLDCGILPGITREVIIEICRKKQIPIKEGRFMPERLKDVEEVFLTNTLMGILPVRTVKSLFEKSSFVFSSMLAEELDKIFLEQTDS